MGSQYKSRPGPDLTQPNTDSDEVFYCRKNWQPEIIQTEIDLIWFDFVVNNCVQIYELDKQKWEYSANVFFVTK